MRASLTHWTRGTITVGLAVSFGCAPQRPAEVQGAGLNARSGVMSGGDSTWFVSWDAASRESRDGTLASGAMVDEELGLFVITEGFPLLPAAALRRHGGLSAASVTKCARGQREALRGEAADRVLAGCLQSEAVAIHRRGKEGARSWISMTAVLVRKDQAVAAHAGTTAMHVVRDRTVTKVTDDQTLGEGIERGWVSTEFARNLTPEQSKLPLPLGWFEESHPIKTYTFPTKPGDRLVLSTAAVASALGELRLGAMVLNSAGSGAADAILDQVLAATDKQSVTVQGRL